MDWGWYVLIGLLVWYPIVGIVLRNAPPGFRWHFGMYGREAEGAIWFFSPLLALVYSGVFVVWFTCWCLTGGLLASPFDKENW